MRIDKNELAAKLKNDRVRIDSRMNELLPGRAEKPELLHEAMRYSTLEGGKRIRGIISIWTHQVCGNRYPEAAIDAACALEFLHAYTLIHDDLPSMDDDDLRRGKSSCHVKYSPAIAILAGDALQALAFETLTRMKNVPAEHVVEAVRLLALSAGSTRLVGGQAADIQYEGTEPTARKVQYIHANKTAELIAASMELGAVISGGRSELSESMRSAGMKAGLAFQIVDDLLDIEGNRHIVGKKLRKDSAKGKITYPEVFGADRSREKAEALIREGSDIISGIDTDGFIDYIFDLIINRIH